jgi:hypothetical protein
MILRIIGSLLLVAVIFFGSFLAYIVFNPDQAAFFVNIFGINPSDIKDLLKRLINGSFGIMVLILSIVWIMSLFRAIWTPREQRRRRMIGWLTASIVGILLFSILALWAYLFRVIKDTAFDNLSGSVTMYDNDIYTHIQTYPDAREYASVPTTTNLVWPITIKYDLSTNARAIAKKNLITITAFEIDSDGAVCINGKSSISGSNPIGDEGIICTFDQIRSYRAKGTYTGTDRLGQTQTIMIPLDPVEIKWLIGISRSTNKSGKKIITFDAARAKNLGNPRWQSSVTGSQEEAKSTLTTVVDATPTILCLRLMTDACDRYYIIADNDTTSTTGTIVIDQDTTQSLSTRSYLSGTSINENEIIGVDWVSGDGTRMCQGLSIRDICNYTWVSYGAKSITATIRLADSSSRVIVGSLDISEPLLLARHARILDQDGKMMNPPETFDPTVAAYVISDLTVPTTITLDAQDVVTENLGYSMNGVFWRISAGGKLIEEKVWAKVTLTLPQTQRYSIDAIYTFAKGGTGTGDLRTARDTIILDLTQRPLQWVIKIQQSSDYVPVKVTIDASSSTSKNGTIQKFRFDFGEGRPSTEGDAIQTYEYRTSGEKKITVTIIDNNGETDTVTKNIVLKDTPKTVGFSTSMSPWVVGTPIDMIADKATGQIEEWIWNYGDDTPVMRWYETTHSYTRAGTYSITLTVRYVDGTEKTTIQPIIVQTTLE